MCAIGRDLDTSVGANSPSTAMLGTGAIGARPTPRRNTLLTAGGQTGGTLLSPTSGAKPISKPVGGPTKMQR